MAPVITGFSPTSGPRRGTQVVIAGANLAGASQVTFEGVAATGVTNIADDEVPAVSGSMPAPGQVTITVTARGSTGQPAPLSFDFL